MLKDVATLIQTASWAVAVVGGAFAIWKHFAESREKRLWEKVKLAKQMLDQLDANPRALDAAYMIGAWPRRTYRSEQSLEPFELEEQQLVVVLTPAYLPKTKNEQYVRECFDNFLFHVEQCIGASEQGLVEWEQLRPMLVTLFVGASQPVGRMLSMYASHLGYQRCAREVPGLVVTARARH